MKQPKYNIFIFAYDLAGESITDFCMANDACKEERLYLFSLKHPRSPFFSAVYGYQLTNQQLDFLSPRL